MHARGSVLRVAAFLAMFTGLSILSATAALAGGGSASVIHACIRKDTHVVRIVRPSHHCRPSERAISWFARAEAGPSGPAGATGPTGPAGMTGPVGPTGPAGSTDSESQTNSDASGSTGPGNDASASDTNLQISDVIFPWAHGGFGKNWFEGLLRFVLGVVGGLVTTYLFIGDFLPSMGGRVEYDLLSSQLDDLRTRRNETMTLLERYVKGDTDVSQERLLAGDRLTDDFDQALQRLETQVNKERWRLFLIGFPIYVLLGGFFATAFATNQFQALLIGFGWTAVADRIGLGKQLEQRKSAKDERVATLETQALAGANALQTATRQEAQIRDLDAAVARLKEEKAVAERAASLMAQAVSTGDTGGPQSPSAPGP